MEKDKKSAVIGVILSICILVMWNLMLAEPVHASEGSLLIEAHYKKDDGTSIPIPRDYYSIYKVAHEEKDAIPMCHLFKISLSSKERVPILKKINSSIPWKSM